MKKIFLLILLVSFSFKNFAQTDTAKFGMYVTNLFDIDIAAHAYNIEFWLWANYKNPKLNFEKTIEIKSAKAMEFGNYYQELKGGGTWMQKKIKATILKDYNIKDFPFDKQKLVLNLEETQFDNAALTYTVDVANSKVDSALKMEQWQIDSFVFKQKISDYNTTYGDPTLNGSSTYAGVEANFYISRKSSGIIFLKYTTGLYVSFLISLLVFAILRPDPEARVGLAVGSLFMAVGNKNMLEGILSTSTENTLIDSLHNITFIYILFIIVSVISTSILMGKGQEDLAKKINKYSCILVISSYLLINFLMVKFA
jgi:hypothetical protein